jgi:hypothetical protein
LNFPLQSGLALRFGAGDMQARARVFQSTKTRFRLRHVFLQRFDGAGSGGKFGAVFLFAFALFLDLSEPLARRFEFGVTQHGLARADQIGIDADHHAS